MSEINNHSNRIKSALESVLPAGSSLVFQRYDGIDTIFKLAGKQIRVRWIAAGWPAQVRETLSEHAPLPDLMVAAHFSVGARELLKQKAIGWLDESGSAEFILERIIISRTAIRQLKVPTPRSERWSPALLAVAEAILCGTPPTVEAIAEITSLSTGASTKTLRTLTDLGLLTADVARGRLSRRRIKDERQFLDAYVAAVDASMRRRTLALEVGGTWQDLVQGIASIGRIWDEQGTPWATTGTVAAEVMAPTMTTLSSAVIYVDAVTLVGLTALAQRAGLRPIEGGRVTLKPFPTVSCRRLASIIDNIRVTAWPRVYADLRLVGVRGEDAAEHLLEVIRGR